MNNEDFQALARRGAIDALKALAAIAVDPTAVASDRVAREVGLRRRGRRGRWHTSDVSCDERLRWDRDTGTQIQGTTNLNPFEKQIALSSH
jgi:hypothetical protein